MSFTPLTVALRTALWCATANAVQGQLVVNSTMTPAQLVQNTLLGPGVTVSNVIFNGLPATLPNAQVAHFLGADCVLVLDSGLLLATGEAEVGLGPNNSGSAQVEVLDNFFQDNDLDNVAGDMAMDVACLEFDFVPSGDSISFNYSFASEEYLEWVGSIYNDAFGFFLSGPGIFGPFDNDAINLAVAPGTLNYVSVNTINDVTNAAFYQDNGDGFTAPFSTDPYYFQFDGFTVGLKAGAAVQCGQTYHIKLAVGDVGDPNWDSGVFIQGGTFTSTGGAGITITTSTGATTVSESCDDAMVTIVRPGTSGDLVVPVSASGTINMPADVTGVPATVTIPDGSSSVSFPIAFPSDGLLEGNEMLILCVSIQGACGAADSACASVTIVDSPPIVIMADDFISDCSGVPVTLTASASGGSGDLQITWSTGSEQSSITVPDQPATYQIIATDACGNQTSTEVNVIAPCAFIVPNVFSPNNDGSNDTFEIPGIEFFANQVRIYNRWGQVVFEATNYDNDWDGRPVSDGTYFYEVSVQGQEKPLTGHLTILANRN